LTNTEDNASKSMIKKEGCLKKRKREDSKTFKKQFKV
jgi:hypothetical protein